MIDSSLLQGSHSRAFYILRTHKGTQGMIFGRKISNKNETRQIAYGITIFIKFRLRSDFLRNLALKSVTNLWEVDCRVWQSKLYT
jgi:hypothetical protein